MLTHSRKFAHLFLSIQSFSSVQLVIQQMLSKRKCIHLILRAKIQSHSVQRVQLVQQELSSNTVYIMMAILSRLTTLHLATVTKSLKRADFVNFTSLVWKYTVQPHILLTLKLYVQQIRYSSVLELRD